MLYNESSNCHQMSPITEYGSLEIAISPHQIIATDRPTDCYFLYGFNE